jgi:hypothetical protein
MGSIIALDSSSGEFDVLAGIQIHIELDLALEGIELFLSLSHAADNDDGGDDN